MTAIFRILYSEIVVKRFLDFDYFAPNICKLNNLSGNIWDIKFQVCKHFLQ